MTMLLQAERATARTDRFGHSWEGRRVTVVGLGRSGAAAAELLCRVGARVRLTDARKTPALCRARERLSSLGAEVVELGGHTRTLIEEAELLVVSPGVPESGGPIQWALERRLPILSEIELAFRWCPSPIVAVTGTNGKSTSVSLITELIRACGRPAVACGNLGIPFSSVVDQLTPQTVAVVEVSSFQLLWCDQFRPHIGVLLNIGTNHLDRHQDRQAYCAAKARLFQHQHPEDWAVLNGDDPHVVAIGERVRARRVWFRQNRSNAPAFWVAAETMRSLTESAQAVLQVGRVLGIADPMTWQIIRAFRGLEHRLEFIGTVGGVHFVNDSKSTTPESLLFALNQIRGDVAVILGGRDKGLDFRPLVPRLHETRVKGVVLIGESRTRIRPLLNGSSTVRERDTLDDAVQTAAGLAPPGSTVLFSPACASFDMFRDFEARGRAFKDVVARLLQAEAAAPGPTIRSAGRFGHTSG